MATQRIEINEEFDAPVENVFRYFSEHERLGSIFAPARIRRLSNGDTTRNGVGSSREMRVPGTPPFVETVTAYQENRLIEYRITEGSPLRDHLGVMKFLAVDGDRTRFHYVITFDGKVPFVAPVVRHFLEGGIRRGVRNLRLSNPW
ncbi:SRPBCC family protein [Burkholderia thailandensis]|uniref:Polyketide cyclase / dehydrase and lipid transport family protein n=1 Tax=Burkholderia thailandensis TaxID=57975 RepID=A0AAW9CP61_BURTH|nr:SRPBCC family protein [Burkholderia thailandensis]AHI66333.1 polyketide cyclase / dehydrase and lipid transport family protein [Burkholderia thailandensis H0587]AIP65122.1 polyketide cyclase [Burkholderia thailandensis]AOI54150.1 polyketide cyclase [Burkholderia thailandensis]AOJ53135.1 polyketide cyclase [Burkholderia thailandensis]AVR28750.1 SRPBCC family protein [Burkholderia thailandensis]